MADLPSMPAASGASGNTGRDALLEFHWTGEAAPQESNGLRPALLDALRRSDEQGLAGSSAIELYLDALRRHRNDLEESFRSELGSLLSRVSELLRNDAARDTGRRSSHALDRELGRAGGAMVDADRLAGLVTGLRGATGLTAERRERLERAERTLNDHLQRWSTAPRIVLLGANSWSADETPPDVEPIEGGLEDAVPAFERTAARMVELFRAVRLVRLELAEAYDPGRHDAALERFGWRSVTPQELALFPRVLFVGRTDDADTRTMAAMSELLCSGRPVHVMLLDRPLERRARVAGRTQLEIGYLAVAHREAFVLQSTLARPEHLNPGLGRMVASARAGLALVAVPSDGDRSHGLQLPAADEGLGTPCFRYDPDGGAAWTECFEFEDDTRTERPWPVHRLSYRDEGGAERERDEAFTFAHAAALEPAFRKHFRVVESDAWDDSQIEIADWLALDGAGRRGKLPFVWVVVEGRLARAVVTSDLAGMCHERLETRRLFRELASLGGPAPTETKEPLEAPAAAAPKPEPDEMETIRRQAGEEAIRRLVNVLVGIEEAPAPVAAASSAALPVVQPASAAEPAPAARAPVVEPYIDSALCTTCDDCTKLNSRMFRYNEDKQAYIADASAGTFAELVKAAEKCPARCIHPGAPRDGDGSATDKLVARAARFN